MFARMLKPEERYISDRIRAVAFEFPHDPAKTRADCEALKSEERPAELPCDGLPHEPRGTMTWAAGEGDETYGVVEVVPYPVRFDGHRVLMGGIGGVATLPPYRRSGAIRTCMQAALEDMYDHGYVFSALYPFSRVYYRQFGYENGESTSTWTIPFSALCLPQTGGSIEMVMPGDDLSPLVQVYNACSEKWNLSAVRTRYGRGLPEDRNWLNDLRYVYLWRNDAGEPRGYIVLKKVDGVMVCTNGFTLENELMFRDVEALAALLKLAKSMAADYTAIQFTVPQGVRVDSLISEGNDVQCKVTYNGMDRIVNVKRALELCRAKGQGSLRIAVTDPMLAANRGVWQIDFAPGAPNRVEAVEAPADVELPVSALTQLLLGARGAADIPMMPEVCVRSSDAPLECVFYPKLSHLNELF